MSNTKRHLCLTCTQEVPTCSAKYKGIEFGDRVGNDNVVNCNEYEDINAW